MTLPNDLIPKPPVYKLEAGRGYILECRRVWSDPKDWCEKKALLEFHRVTTGGWLPLGKGALTLRNCRLPQKYPRRRIFYAEWVRLYEDGRIIKSWHKGDSL